ncbi:unnamed protein product [Mytilus edulis]|uniref:Transposable element Tcb1 transposase n=1 Tax=Mytilus edulis TaxID=6550 RepID=A0A8S3V3Z7_MYTED|nr:unnamed protein product [Mytilus edulis]
MNQRPISDDGVWHRLKYRNLSCRGPPIGPILTPRHSCERLQWAIHQQNWRHQQWKTVIFGDKIRYSISNADVRTRIWSRQGERYAENCILERDPWRGPRIMVWGGIGLNHKLRPVVFQNLGPGRGNGVKASRYTDQVLRRHVVPHFARFQNNTFQHDNAHSNTGKATRDFLQQGNITIIYLIYVTISKYPLQVKIVNFLSTG